MDDGTITAVAVTATINIVTIVGMIYYLKGKVEEMEKRFDSKINDLKDFFNTRINDIKESLNARLSNVEDIVYRRDEP